MSSRAPFADAGLEPGQDGAGEDCPDLLEAVTRRVQHTLDLAAQEAELAAVSALVMVSLIVLAAAAIIVGWSLLVAIMIFLLASAGLSWLLAALVFAVLHAALAAVCWRIVVRLSRNLTLPALRGVLTKRRRVDAAGDVGADLATRGGGASSATSGAPSRGTA